MRALIPTLTALLLATVFAGVSLAEPTVNGPDHRAIRVAEGTQGADFPLIMSGTLESVERISVSIGDPPLAVSDKGFTFRMGKGLVPSVVVEVDTDTVAPDAYSLELLIGWKDGEEVVKTPLNLTVTVPQPAVVVPDRLIMHRKISVFGGITSEESTPLTLREGSGRAPLKGLSLVQFGSLRLKDGGEVPGVISLVGDAPEVLAASGNIELPWTVRGELSPGVTEGRFDVIANGLNEPTQIEVEIHTRVSAWWILPITLFGVLLGFVVRQLLAGYHQKRLAVDQARKVVARIEHDLSTTADASHRDTLDALRRRLVEVARTGNPDEILAAAESVEGERTEARTAFTEAKQIEAERHRALQVSLSGRPVPDRVDELVVLSLKGVAERLNSGKIGEARRTLDGLDGPLLPPIRQAWESWRLDALRAIDAQDKLGDLQQDFDTAPAIDALHSFETAAGDWGGLFESGGATAATLHNMTTNLWLTVDREARALVGRLASPAKLRIPIETTLDAVRSALSDYADGPLTALHLMCEVLPPQIEALVLDGQSGEEAQNKVAQRRFVEAVPAAAGYEMESSLEGVESVPAPIAPRPPTAAPPPTPTGWRRWVAVADDPDAEAASVLSPPSVAVTWLSKLLLSAANAAVISLLAYVLYVDQFLGTGKEVATLLLWAFGLDLGATAVTQRIQETVSLER